MIVDHSYRSSLGIYEANKLEPRQAQALAMDRIRDRCDKLGKMTTSELWRKKVKGSRFPAPDVNPWDKADQLTMALPLEVLKPLYLQK